METQGKFNEFITSVLKHVRFKEAHSEIRRELISHLNDALELGIGFGHSQNEIESRVIRQMGNPDDLGKKLDAVHQPKFDVLLLSMMSVLLGTGLYSLSFSGWMKLQLLWGCLGLIPLVGLTFVRLSDLRRWSWRLYGFTIMILLAAYLFGAWHDGQPYLSLGPVKIKVVDFSVVLFAISLAGPFSADENRSWRATITALLAALFPLVAYLAIGSVYPAILLFLASTAMLIGARRPAWVALSFAGTSGILLGTFSRKAGLLEGSQHPTTISADAHTDFVLRFIEMNTSGAAWATVAVAMSMIAYLASIGSSVKNGYGRTLVASAFAIIGSGLMFGIMANIGFVPMPTTGINLPFLSYGGSLLIGHMALIGIVLGIQRRRNLHMT